MAIIRLLATRATCTCGELVAELPLSQSTVSQHLKELKTAGLVESASDGPRACYCLSPARWVQVRQLFENVLVELPAKPTQQAQNKKSGSVSEAAL